MRKISRDGGELSKDRDSIKEVKPSLVSTEERKNGKGEDVAATQDEKRHAHLKFQQTLKIDPLVQSQMSIWEDSIHEMLFDTVNELASTENYATKVTDRCSLIEEAFCRKALTSKL